MSIILSEYLDILNEYSNQYVGKTCSAAYEWIIYECYERCCCCRCWLFISTMLYQCIVPMPHITSLRQFAICCSWMLLLALQAGKHDDGNREHPEEVAARNPLGRNFRRPCVSGKRAAAGTASCRAVCQLSGSLTNWLTAKPQS